MLTNIKNVDTIHTSQQMIELVAEFFKKLSVIYCVRLSVRTVGFQPTKRGSTPLRSTILKHIAEVGSVRQGESNSLCSLVCFNMVVYGVVIQWQNMRLLTVLREFDSLQPYQKY